MKTQATIKRSTKRLTLYRVGRHAGGVVNALFKIFACVIFAFPFFWMIITSLKTYGESIQFPPTLLPADPSVQSYITVFQSMDLWNFIKNTLIVTVAVMVLNCVTVVPCAYALAKYDFKGKGLLWGLIMGAKMVPTVITFIPVYIMFSKLRFFGEPMINSLWPQILPFGTSAFNIFLLRQNFMQIPEEVIESARLDNASEFKIMWKVMLPMAKSTMVTIMLLTFISHWNAYFWPLVMCNTEEFMPISLAISRLSTLEYGLQWPTIMAGSLILTGPVLILFILASKKIISSMAYRGVK